MRELVTTRLAIEVNLRPAVGSALVKEDDAREDQRHRSGERDVSGDGQQEDSEETHAPRVPNCPGRPVNNLFSSFSRDMVSGASEVNASPAGGTEKVLCPSNAGGAGHRFFSVTGPAGRGARPT